MANKSPSKVNNTLDGRQQKKAGNCSKACCPWFIGSKAPPPPPPPPVTFFINWKDASFVHPHSSTAGNNVSRWLSFSTGLAWCCFCGSRRKKSAKYVKPDFDPFGRPLTQSPKREEEDDNGPYLSPILDTVFYDN
eukprot:GHVN01016811.1.p1 GENE.GHVN01016811.1~~GHVN01016811.1.p1  ORF type:complete len:135 (-),score=18.66 GHVN01016811.1:224-628(-)